MKNIFTTTVLLLLSLLFCITRLGNAAVPCTTVDVKAAACVTFATGKDARPSAACCSGLQHLAQSVKTVDDKKEICRCLKDGVKNFAGVQDKYLSKIPDACKIKVTFPVSLGINCETIH